MLEKSQSIAKLTAAVAKVQQELKPVAKSETNPHFRNSFAPLEEILKMILPITSKHGLAFMCCLEGEGEFSILLSHESGEYLSWLFKLPAKDLSDPQKVGGAVTYMRRYMICSVFGIGTEDDDGNTASQPAKPKAPTTPMTTDELSKVLAKLESIKTAKGFSDSQVLLMIKSRYKKETLDALSFEQGVDLLKELAK